MSGRGDWKSLAADRLDRMGLGKQAKALYGIGENHTTAPELSPHAFREASRRRAARAKAPPKSLFGRLRAWLLL